MCALEVHVGSTSPHYPVHACAAGVECLVCLSVCLFVCLFVCLSVCPPLFGLFARSRHSQELFIHSTGRSGGTSSL